MAKEKEYVPVSNFLVLLKMELALRWAAAAENPELGMKYMVRFGQVVGYKCMAYLAGRLTGELDKPLYNPFGWKPGQAAFILQRAAKNNWGWLEDCLDRLSEEFGMSWQDANAESFDFSQQDLDDVQEYYNLLVEARII